jgi:hypothetical protein
VLNSWTTALLLPFAPLTPAAAAAVFQMSKFGSTVLPFRLTLNTRLPAAVKYVSAKWRRIRFVDPTANPGIVYVTAPVRAVW